MHFRIEIEEDILLEKSLDEKDLPRMICINCKKDLETQGENEGRKGIPQIQDAPNLFF